MRILFVVLFTCVSLLQLNAQDQDFSQYYASPMSLNPALAGTFNGTYRVGGNYRQAWRNVSPVPITTYAFNGEYRFIMGAEKKKSDYGSAGVKFYSDRTSIIEHNTNAVSALFAFHKSLSQFSNQYLSIGFEAGIVQKNLNYENLNFEDEFNGVNGFEGFTGEDLQPNNFGYGDFAVGMNYSTEIDNKNDLYIGFTAKHLSTPNVSFWRKNDSNNPDLIKTNNLPILLGFQASSKNEISYGISIQPRIIAQFQGVHTQVFAGSTIRIDLITNRKSAVHAGLFGRISKNESSFGLAHLTPFVGFEVNEMLMGFSYDINMRDIVNQYQGIGVFEFSITYTGEVLEDSAFCPQF